MTEDDVKKLNRLIGLRIKDLRKTRGYNLKTAAKMLDISYQQLQKYETGSNSINAPKLYELSKMFSCSVGYFFYGFETFNEDNFIREIEDLKTNQPSTRNIPYPLLRTRMDSMIKVLSRIDELPRDIDIQKPDRIEP